MDQTPYSGLPIPDLGDIDDVPSWLTQFGVSADLKLVLSATSRSDMTTRFPAADLGSDAALCIIGPSREVWMHAPDASTWTALIVPPEGWKQVPTRQGYKNGFQAFQYRRRWAAPGLWVVSVRGSFTGNDDSLDSGDAGAYVADMPLGYRPPQDWSLPGKISGPAGGPPTVDFDATGGVQFVQGDATLPVGSCAVYGSWEIDVSLDDLQ